MHTQITHPKIVIPECLNLPAGRQVERQHSRLVASPGHLFTRHLRVQSPDFDKILPHPAKDLVACLPYAGADKAYVLTERFTTPASEMNQYPFT